MKKLFTPTTWVNLRVTVRTKAAHHKGDASDGVLNRT